MFSHRTSREGRASDASEERARASVSRPGDAVTEGDDNGAPPKAKAGSAEERAARKTLARLDKRLERIAEREAELNAQVLEHASDHVRLAEISRELGELSAEKDEVELEWLEAAEVLE